MIIAPNANCTSLLHLDGNVSDSSGQNVSWSLGAGSFVIGRYGQGVSNPNISTTNTILESTAALTIEAWINLASIPTSGGKLYTIANNGTYFNVFGYAFDVSSTGLYFAWGANGTTYYSVSGSFPWVTGVWYHVAVVYSNPNATLYVNGRVVGGPGGNGALAFNSSYPTTYIGTGNGAGDSAYGLVGQFYGVIDEIAFWNYARPSADILRDADAFLGAVLL